MSNNVFIQTALSDEEARNRRGRNIIQPPAKRPLWLQYADKFRDPLIIVLLVVFVFSVGVSIYQVRCNGAALTTLLEPLGVLIALLLATGVGFIFEVKAAKEFDVLNRVKDARPVKVFRRKRADSEPRLCQVRKQDVCEGDIVRLESGDEIPADGTLLESTQLRVDESNFTGELYANKSADPAQADADATYPTDFLLRGATVIEGTALMRITAVGMQTEEGRGVARTREESDVQTPLNQQLSRLGRIISLASFIIGGLIIVGRFLYFFITNAQTGHQPDALETFSFILNSVMIAVTLIVVAVPEGLPLSVTMSLALSMRRMLREKNLVRRLHACETMGAATVICTDKTGTLTRNQMTVVATDFPDDSEELLRICCNMGVNSTAEVERTANGTLECIGNPTEVALLKWMHAQGHDYTALRRQSRIISAVPFSTERKYMETTVRMPQFEQPIRLIKGAPEIVMAMCTAFAAEGKPQGEEPTAATDERSTEINDERTAEHYNARLAAMQQQAMRTLAFAYQFTDANGNATSPLTFSGIVGIADPVRSDVPAAIDLCMNHAGVRVIIVTGDTPGTALQIGRQIGLVGENDGSIVTTGAAFAAMSDTEALKFVSDSRFKIISRARPDDKARLVMLLQQAGHVVAVTGDGTNDAPALAKAQVGLSMGDGTARAKEASDITIIDNSFASINRAIMWGRSLYQNIRRFILFQMTINVCACLIVLFGACTGLDSPLTVTQMLWVNLIMDTFAAMALSSLPADPGVLEAKPRRATEQIINRQMARSMLVYGMIFFAVLVMLWQLLWRADYASFAQFLADADFSDVLRFSHPGEHLSAYELGLFFSCFVMIQFWNLFNARYFATRHCLIADLLTLLRGRGNPFSATFSRGFWLVMIAILLGQIIIVQFASEMFNVAPLSVCDWLLIIATTSLVLIIPDVIRYCQSRH